MNPFARGSIGCLLPTLLMVPVTVQAESVVLLGQTSSTADRARPPSREVPGRTSTRPRKKTKRYHIAVPGVSSRFGTFSFPVPWQAHFANDFGAGTHATPGSPFNNGIDIFAPQGTPIVAPVDGTIHAAGWSSTGGNRLHLIARDGTDFYFAHMTGFAPGIRSRVRVERGRRLGWVGATGNARGTSPHLHFGAVRRGLAINPYSALESSHRTLEMRRKKSHRKATFTRKDLSPVMGP